MDESLQRRLVDACSPLASRGRDAKACAAAAAGRHLCHFYRDEAEYVTLVSAFLGGAKAADERAVWVLPSWLGAAAAVRGLELAGARPISVELRSMGSVYLRPDGALRDRAEMVDFWRARVAEARDAGFRGLRATGDGTDQAAASAWSEMESSERAADEAQASLRITSLCTYSLRRVPAARLSAILDAHRGALVRRGALWDELAPGPASAAALGVLQRSAN